MVFYTRRRYKSKSMDEVQAMFDGILFIISGVTSSNISK